MEKTYVRYCERLLYNYHDLQKEIEEREEVLNDCEKSELSIQSNKTSKPTEATALRLASDKVLVRLKREKRAIDFVLDVLYDDEKKLIEKKYWARGTKKNR